MANGNNNNIHTHTEKTMWLDKPKSRKSAARPYIVYLDLNCIILFTVRSNGIEKNQSMGIIKPVKGSDIEHWKIKLNIENETRKKNHSSHYPRDETPKHEENEYETKKKKQKVKHQPKPKPKM